MSALPETTRMRPRPVWLRARFREAGLALGPVTDDLVRDAIRVLERGSLFPESPWLDRVYAEAELILAEVGR